MSTPTAGHLLRTWRENRRVSQLALAHGAGVSPRHLSFIETGRSRPTSQMILRLCRHLEVPLREQNRLLLAAGFAPAHPEHDLSAPPMATISHAIELILAAHLPYPALVVDRGWDLVSANDAVYALLDGVGAELLEPPVNVIRLALDPAGLAPRIANLEQWRDHLVERLAREYAVSADARLRTLLDEYGPLRAEQSESAPGLVVPLRLRTSDGELSLISTTTVFGTPREVTVSELAIETFLPADAATRAALSAG
ncbi:helix-turn-helix transcriptional regulator [Nocardioides sp. InS609-2]|uniref:helix-turn-helix domain-containing protein n=1 Tax=Nocardioides sp. InS609-2 TaxID=2760705 RepID=UPI0020C063E8|nr:helix-turn-helix transcriptional regulator [Nocardioides sp. InS609-2]